MGKLPNQVSPALSWPAASASKQPPGSLSSLAQNRLKKRLKLEAKRRFMFDPMCGIPGPSSTMDYQLLRFVSQEVSSTCRKCLVYTRNLPDR